MNHRRIGHHPNMSTTDTEKEKGYEILSFLGKGAFACVYKAKSDKREVAIKRIEKETTKARRMVARVRKEVEIHSRLKHPSILEVYDYFEDSRYVYLVLELCHNGEFQHYLNSQGGVLTEAEAQKVMRQVVEGVQYLQKHQILHRDLTLSNLLLTRDMKTKIADFGLATQLTEPEEKHFTMCGTPNYMAPEVAKREAHGPEADVWSLGCMLYTMLVGKHPFDSGTIRDTLGQVIEAEYDLPSNLSPKASDLIQRLLRENPAERLPLKDVLRHPFMCENSVATQDIIQMSEISMDSGHGTLATVGSGHSSSSIRGQLTTAGMCDLWKQTASSQQKYKGSVTRKPSPLSTNSAKANAFETTMGPTQFDPHQYQKLQDSHSSFNWSFTTNSVNSHGGLPASHKPQIQSLTNRVNGQESGFASQEDFSLQSTKKPLDFDGCSHQNNLELSSVGSGVLPQIPVGKVQAYLGQCQHLVTSNKEKRHRGAGFYFPAEAMDLSTREQINKVMLTEQQMYRHVHIGSMENLSSPHSSSGGGGKSKSAGGDGKSDTADRPTEPLNTQRLLPIRQKTKNAVINIMDNGNVCLEFVKNKGKEQRVVEVFSISSDGQQVTVFHPGDRGRGVAVSDCPPSPLSACKTFTFQSLPGKYFKKYQYAARFIDLVRSKTPKVTMYTEKAKCMLMENSQPADFEATFYEGAKVSFSQRGICILEKEGTSLMLDSVKSSLHLNQDTRELVDYSEKCRQQCMQLEAVISAVQSNGILKNQLLPVIVGSLFCSVHSYEAMVCCCP
ncbi:serine/threonine-protein kinase PLK4-like isoform X2 [Pomacea canaliculata]|uniref:serine/threonine-protein kinase PLK4-like isoform X2 n=1 Tax=Pomacea canaliculata TaxID=400727 RepID=UPI000D72C4AB|nr:serine/threonine-protein kinase PLK4-like isoform X2 [Pomacea canaliculata]